MVKWLAQGHTMGLTAVLGLVPMHLDSQETALSTRLSPVPSDCFFPYHFSVTDVSLLQITVTLTSAINQIHLTSRMSFSHP